ncbi:uncharacterized protein RHO25_006227 [Cercospora beticola]|uniref:Secreted protein n=1 Tax=Cercospora beticola TaxID=122368 RepID=A0ABZ0NPW0_CERBT|nr:hypothetical protein RHO25_006227 [Cercospora beticola]CAK1363606.1 unnamed protein product [Cercospora beticola]
MLSATRLLLATLLLLGPITLADDDKDKLTPPLIKPPKNGGIVNNPIQFDVFTYDDNDCQYVLNSRKRFAANRGTPCYPIPVGFDSYHYNIYQGVESANWVVPNAVHGNCDWRDGCGHQRTDIFLTRHGLCNITVFPNAQCKGLPIHTHEKANWQMNANQCIKKFFMDPVTKQRVRGHSMAVWCQQFDQVLKDEVHYPNVLNLCPAGPPDQYDIRQHEKPEDPYFWPDFGYEPKTKSCEKKPTSSSKSTGPAMTTISTVLVVPIASVNTTATATASSSASSAALQSTSLPAMKTRTSIIWLPPTTST